MQLGSLCTGLVKVGGHLERNNPYALNRLQASCHNSDLFLKSSFESHEACITAKKMHMFEPVNLQVLLTNLCQDSSLDIVLRLQLLEVISSNEFCCSQVYFVLQVIELRSLGWKKNPTVEKYYKERSCPHVFILYNDLA